MAHVHLEKFDPKKTDWIVGKQEYVFHVFEEGANGYTSFDVSEKKDPRTARKLVFKQGGGEDKHPRKSGAKTKSFIFAELSLVDQYGLPFLRIYRRRFEGGYQESYIELVTIPRADDHNSSGAIIIRYTADGRRQILQGMGEVDERKRLNCEGHPYTNKVPQKINFQRTFTDFIAQVNSENFNLPKLYSHKLAYSKVS